MSHGAPEGSSGTDANTSRRAAPVGEGPSAPLPSSGAGRYRTPWRAHPRGLRRDGAAAGEVRRIGGGHAPMETAIGVDGPAVAPAAKPARRARRSAEAVPPRLYSSRVGGPPLNRTLRPQRSGSGGATVEQEERQGNR